MAANGKNCQNIERQKLPGGKAGAERKEGLYNKSKQSS